VILKELANIEDSQKAKAFVIANHDEIIKAKKRELKWSDPLAFTARPSDTATKVASDGKTFDIVGNSAGFMDSHMDVSMSGSYDKTVSESAKYAPILENHIHSPKGIIGRNKGVEVRHVSIKDLGYNKEGTTEAVVFKIDPCYDEKMRTLYANGEIKQHSIGLQYVKIEMCVNDDSDNKGFANWNKYIGQVINREKAEDAGYFFAVLEQKIFEVSAVLFGSNGYTPTLGKLYSLENEPPNGTQDIIEPSAIIQGFKNALN
jgi:hypothetical protein